MAVPPTPTESEVSNPPSTPLATQVPIPSPVPPPVPVETHPNRAAFKPVANRVVLDSKRFTANDASKTFSPPRLRPLTEVTGSAAAAAAAAALRPAIASLRAPPAIPPVAARLAEEKKRRRAARKSRQPHVWKKLLWIKQHGFPDNYTDTETFLDHLQLNPRLRPYELWPLVADSTVIVQHVCSVAIFICAYAGIYQDRLSPVAVVTCGTVATIVGWISWDHWVGQEAIDDLHALKSTNRLSMDVDDVSSTSSGGFALPVMTNGHMNGKVGGKGLGLTLSTSNLAAKNKETIFPGKHNQSLSKSSFQSISPIDNIHDTRIERFPEIHPSISNRSQSPNSLSNSTTLRNQARLKTFKSALLIYFALLGLSPILKSLTKSTSSDSIWALATWLLIINIFFFDYRSLYVPTPTRRRSSNISPTSKVSEGIDKPGNLHYSREKPTAGAIILTRPSTTATPIDSAIAPTNTSIRAPPFPSSLSTNAALMASTVLASRLLNTTAVFSLTLFSIQVFGLFPVFRRHLRHVSFNLHIVLTLVLITMSSTAIGVVLSRSHTHTYGNCGFCLGWIWHVVLHSMIGFVVGGFSTAFIMGGCSWWLIGLQRYKNVVIGPWDPAKPVLAGGDHARSRTGTN